MNTHQSRLGFLSREKGSIRLLVLISLVMSGLGIAGNDHAGDDAFWADAAALLPGFNGTPAEPGPSNQDGTWSDVKPWPFIPVSAATLPNGKVLTYAGQERTSWPGTKTQTYWGIWDPKTEQFDEGLYLDHEMFCAHLVMRTDGILQTIGGRYTIEHSSFYDWRTNRWVRADDMHDRRWYPTSVALPDGDVFTVSGSGGPNTAELFDHNANQWKRLSGINWQPVAAADGFESHWWPYLFVAPDGKMFHFGPTETMHWVDASGDGSRVSASLSVPGDHYPKHAGVVMYESGKFLVAGGATATDAGASTNKCYVVDVNTNPPTVRMTNSMAHSRRFQNTVVLPNGEVLIAGGNTSGQKFSDVGTVLTPEIWNPQTEQWREVADMATPRNYHSVGLLLQDGRAFIGGSGYNAGSANHQDVEIYTPPSLYDDNGDLAPRPVITAAPENVATGSVFEVSASPNIQKFALIRMMATTHGLSTDQRYLSIPFSETSSGNYKLVAHPNVNVMIPGYWMLFALDAEGVHSEAAIIHIKEVGDSAGSGLNAEYHDGIALSSLKASRVDHKVDFQWSGSSPYLNEVGNDTFSVRWTGWVVPDYTETYTFYTNSDDGVRLWVDGTQLVNNWTAHAPTENSGTIALTAGVPVPIRLNYYEQGGSATMQLRWSSPRTSKQIIPERNLRISDPTGSSVVSVDDVFELYVDGQLVQVGTEWDKAYHAAFSTGATTTLAIRACNISGPAHAIGDFRINGLSVVTDSTWKVSTALEENWSQPGFDDSGWSNATDNGGVPSNINGMPVGTSARNIWAADSSADEVFLRLTLGAPEIHAIADQLGTVGNSATLDVQATASQISDLEFDATGLPPGLGIDPDTGEISGTPISEGVYDVTATVTDLNGAGSDSTTFQWVVRLPGQGSGSVLREAWNGVSGGTVADLLADPRYPDAPDTSEQATAFPIAQDSGDNYGSRIRGYIHTPVTGSYQFWLSTDNGGRLLLSSDEDPANAVEIASIPDGSSAGVIQWDAFPQQQSAPLQLQGGQRFYFEILQIETAGTDHINLGWKIPGDTSVNVVDAQHLSPFQPNRKPVFATITNKAGTVGDAVSEQVTATDDDGDQITYGANGLPSDLQIDPATGAIFGTLNVAGTYDVEVTADDGRGGITTADFVWTVNQTLTLVAPVTSPEQSGNSVTFTASSGGGSSPTYTWNFGDGSDEVVTGTPEASHTYASPGRYTITLTAADSNGDEIAVVFHHNAFPALTVNRPVSSQSIVLEERAGNDRVWNVNPDNDTVTVHDAITNLKLAELAVGDGPRSLAIAPDGNVVVASKDAAELAIIDTETLAVIQTASLKAGAQPFGVAFSPGNGTGFVVLEGTGEIVQFDAATLVVQGRASVGANPRHFSINHDGSTLFVSRFISPPVPGEEGAAPNPATSGGEVVLVNASNLAVTGTILLQTSVEPDSGGGARGIPNYLGAAALSPANDMAWVPSKQDNIQRGGLRDGRSLTHDTISRAITSRIDLATLTETYSARVDHDDSALPISAVFGPNGLYVFVAIQSSNEVAVIDAYGQQELFRFDAGRAAQGLALSADGRTLFVHNFMERSVSVHDVAPVIDQGQPVASLLTTLSTVATEKLSAQVLQGKRLFYDAVDDRLSSQDYISCATCHDDGRHDGRVWDFTNLGEGVRNTIDLRGRGGMAHGPVHWTGNFDEIQDFEIPIRGMAGGNGLIDGTPHPSLGLPNGGRSTDLDALAAYVASLDTFDDSPYRNADGSMTSEGEAGREIVRNQNCASCHSGTRFTDSAVGVLHDVGTLTAASGQRLSQVLTGMDTPTLRGLWNGAPFLHDGSAATIEEAVDAHSGISLSATQLQQVAAYLQQVDELEAEAPTVILNAPTIASFDATPLTIVEGESTLLSWNVSDGGSPLTSLEIDKGIGSVLGTSSVNASPTTTTTYTIIATNAIGSDSASVTVTVEPATGGDDPDEYPVTPDVIALYHLNGNYNDESGNGFDLTKLGGAQFISDNLGWMNNPAGQAVRFTNPGDALEVDIPAFTVISQEGDPLTIEARIFVRGFVGWSNGNFPIILLKQEWDSHFGLEDRMWGSNPRGPNLVANGTTLLSAQQTVDLLSPGAWHLLQISFDGNEKVDVRIDGTLVNSVNRGVNPSRKNDWTLTLGNFDGDIDEVVIRSSAEPGSTNPPPPPVDTTPPAVTVSGPSSVTSSFNVDIVFSEDVAGLGENEVSVSNGTVSNFGGSGNAYSLIVTPVATGDVEVSIPAGVASDGAGNPNTASNVLSVAYSPPPVDTTPPAVTVSGPSNATGSFNVSIVFSEDVAGLEENEISVSNGAVSSFGGSGDAYSLVISPVATGDVEVSIPAGVANDGAGNPNTASNILSVAYSPPPADTTPPSVTVSGPPSASGFFEVDIVFSENVVGFGVTEINIANGSASNFSGSGTTYSLIVTPVAEGNVEISIPAGVADDEAGNPNVASNLLTVAYTSPGTGGDPPVAGLIAHYPMDSDFDDASGNGYHLSNTGGVTIVAGAAHFTGNGETLTASIPDSVLEPGGSPVTFEYQILPRAYTAWGVDTLDVVALHQEWDSSLSLNQDKWDSNRAPVLKSGNVTLVTSQEWKDLVPEGLWSTVSVTYDGVGIVECRINGAVVASTAWTTNSSRKNDWLLTLGNFNGDIDNVVIYAGYPETEGSTSLVGRGLTADYFEGEFEQLRYTRIDPTINFDWGFSSPIPEVSNDNFSVRWKGCLQAEFGGTYTFYATADDGIRVLIDDVVIIDNWDGTGSFSGVADLEAGVPAMLVVEYREIGGTANARLEWSSAKVPREVIPSKRLTVNETSVVDAILSSYPGSWGEWVASTRSNGTSVTTPGSNADGDYFVDLLEYALGTSPGTGISATAGAGVHLEMYGDEQSITAVYRRPSAVGDIDYVLEVSSDHQEWVPVFAESDTTVTRHDDGTETVRVFGIEATAGYPTSGFVRLRVDLVDSNYSAATPVSAWMHTPLHEGYQTIGISTVNPPVFAGEIDSANGETLRFTGGGDLASVIKAGSEAGQRYYLEIRSGEHEGERMDVDALRTESDRIALDPGSEANTIAELSADVEGERFVIRTHRTIDQVFDKGMFEGDANPSASDRLHFYDTDIGGYASFFLLDALDYLRWTTLADASLTDYGTRVIRPGDGVFLQRSGDGMVMTQIGIVRDNLFRHRLEKGYNLVAGGYPWMQSPEERRIDFDGGFLGDVNPAEADQIQIWQGDFDEAVQGYESLFLLDAGAGSEFRFWTDLGNADLKNRSGSRVFRPDRAAFLLLRESGLPDYRY